MDFTVSADTPDCPPEWGLTLIYNLAELVMPQYPVSPKNVALITDMAPRLLEKMKGHDREQEGIFISPNMDG